MHERYCYSSYDYVTNHVKNLLGENDLDLISILFRLLISRPIDSNFVLMNTLWRSIPKASLMHVLMRKS